jgi:hypothetical protein
MVSKEHKEIYRAIYAERGKQQLHARLAMDGGRVVVMGDAKIARDVPRTFGVFETNMWDKMRLKMEKKERYAHPLAARLVPCELRLLKLKDAGLGPVIT